MRLLAWNIRQGGGFRLPRIADALKRHDADIVVLSEYRGGPSASRLVTALHALGYRHATTLVPPPSRDAHPNLQWRTRSQERHGGLRAGSSSTPTCVTASPCMSRTISSTAPKRVRSPM